MNPTEGMDGAAYGYANMGPYDGGQAECLRVPYADFNLLELPPGTEHENDFTMLSDIFPTGWHGTELAGMQPGDRVAVFGAGPVGLMAAHSAMIRGAAEVFVVDKETRPARAGRARSARRPVDFSAGRPGRADPGRHRRPRAPTAASRRSATRRTTRPARNTPSWCWTTWSRWSAPTGGIGVVGVYVPQDPGAATERGQAGPDRASTTARSSPRASAWAPARPGDALQPAPARPDHHAAGRSRRSSSRTSCRSTEAADGYDHFDKREDGWTKVLLRP